MDVFVVEDSRLAREGLMRMLSVFDDIQVVGNAATAEQALELIVRLRPQVLFLDIHLPGATSFDILNQLDYTPKVVFTTAFSEHAIRSFDYLTVDYLLKPISPSRLAVAVDKLRQSESSVETDTTSKLDMGSKLFFKSQDKCHLISLQDIQVIESCKNYVRVFFKSGDTFVKTPLSKVEQKLPDSHFLRVNRQFIVNLNTITGIEQDFNDEFLVTMPTGHKIALTQRTVAQLRSRFSF